MIRSIHSLPCTNLLRIQDVFRLGCRTCQYYHTVGFPFAISTQSSWQWYVKRSVVARITHVRCASTTQPAEGSATPKSIEESDRAKAEAKRMRRVPIDYSQAYTDNNYIPAVRALTDYLLKPKDLENLRKTTRRSPVTDTPPLTVYLRKDVEQRAVEVWGSMEALQREKKKKREADVEYNLQVSNVKRLLRDIARGRGQEGKQEDRDAFQNDMLKGSRRVVYSAIVINAANFAFKFLAWLYTGSHSMFAESIHSFADTCNQIILGVGLMGSAKKPDRLHPYGYSSLRYVSSLVSGLGIFFFGFGLSVYHGIMGLIHPAPVQSLYWAFFVLGGSLLSEGGTLMVALGQIRKHARQQGVTVWNYVLRGQDPNVNVVLLEDLAAVLGVGICGLSMGLATHYNSHLPDCIGSLCIGGLLGAVASFIIYTNTVALVGRSIPLDLQQDLTKVLESDVLVRSVYDVKAIDLGGLNIRYKAEIDFDGRQLTRSYLDKQDMERMMEEVQNIKTIDELENFMSKHGENIVDLLGSEVDRIEANLKKKYPEVRHVDLEVL
ncbi:proton-coupled zinc antiporter SLC30A9, mitochondrial-like isoform X1 [Paramacrobiotus metropolitanus]|uniref:proton-coupled zinc antiporter SLC30A9, mitochondrial-like isoform X1 n=1 Tax=Paramacrobiotus metropolitanus TaxID=2943436 RepID=UPI0024461942|nr:proton-coupled zinc antiporter SLC30A9, mitochondrial-like isoform X1 [Paramacrobiotus metropolitanus]